MTTAPAPRRIDVALPLRLAIAAAGLAVTAMSALALSRVAFGAVPVPAHARDVAVALHLASVLPALPLGVWLLAAPKGTPTHKALGKVWIVLMLLTAVSALFIRQINHGGFSPIHLFVPLTFWSAWRAVATARAGDIVRHRRGLVIMFFAALVLPGLFSFAPGRLMWFWLFG